MTALRRRTPIVLAIASASALVLSACGSSSSNDAASGSDASSGAAPGASTGAASTLTGTALKVGLITNTGVAIDQSEAVAAAKAAVVDINANGGIAGHPVALDFCNEGLDPNKARACARQMVSDHVIATVGNFVVTAETDVDALLAKAHIPNVGAESLTGDSGTDPNAFTFMTRYDVSNIAMVKTAIDSGAKSISMLALQNPEEGPWTEEVKNAATGLGANYGGTVSVPQVTGDLSTEAAALMQMKPDAVILNASASASLEVMKDMVSLGYTGRFEGGSLQFLQTDLESLGIPNPITINSPFPPASATDVPAVQQFDADMAAEKASGDHDAVEADKIVRSPAFSSWLSAMTVQKIANQAKATTSAALEKAFRSATNVDMGGAIPAWTPNATDSAMPKPRNNATSVWAYTWTGDDVKLDSDKPIDMSSLYLKYTTEK